MTDWDLKIDENGERTWRGRKYKFPFIEGLPFPLDYDLELDENGHVLQVRMSVSDLAAVGWKHEGPKVLGTYPEHGWGFYHNTVVLPGGD